MTKKKLAFFEGYVAFIGVAVVGMLCAFEGIAFAQNTDTLGKVNQLQEVKINEYRVSRQGLSPAPLQILTGPDLQRINSLSVADAIRYFSGVQLKDYGGIGGLKTINVRSMGSNHTAVFYDGIQLGNAQNGQVDLGKYSLDNLEEIALVSGQSDEQLQPAKSYASASAIYLKTRIPAFDDKKYNLTANFKTGDFGLLNPAFVYQHQISDHLSASVSSEYIKANGKYKFRYTNGVYDTTAVRNNGDVNRFRLETAWFGQLNKQGKWHAQVYSFLSDRGLPGAIVANKFDYDQRIWDRNIFVQGNLTQKFGERLAVLINTKLAYDYTRFLDPEYISLNGFLDNRFHEREAYVAVSANYRLTDRWQVSFASDYQYQDLKANLYRFAYPRRNTFLNVLSSSVKLSRFEVQANLLSSTVNDEVNAYSSAGNKQVFSPAVLFSWKIFEESNFRLRGFYKDIFRMPTFNDLYYTFIGNTLLKPEFAQQYDLGFTYQNSFKKQQLAFVEVQADFYYNQVKDKIIAQPGANLIRWIMYNLGRVDIKGAELNLKTGWNFGKELALGTAINYTLQQAMDITDPSDENYGQQIPYIPKHSGSFLAKIDYRNWRANYSFIYTGYRYNQKANIIYNYMEPWYTHDLALGYGFKLKQASFNLNAEVNNLLNQYYDVIPNFPMPGRNYRLTLNFKL